LFGAFNWVPRWFRPDKGLTTNEIARTYLDIFINGIATNRQKL
jgi:hypothetical protein